MNIVCIKNLEKFMDSRQALRLFNKIWGGLHKPTHLLKFKNKTFAFVQFSSQAEKMNFLTAAIPQEYKKLKIKQGFARRDQLKQFQSVQQLSKQREVLFKQATEAQIEQVKRRDIRDIIMPYWSYPYDKQVLLKKQEIQKILQKFKEKMVDQKFDMDFVPATQLTHYRNKTEFTVGNNEEGKLQVGFNKGSFINKTVFVSDPKQIDILPQPVLRLAQILTEQMRKIQEQNQIFKAYNRYEHDEGVWRYVVARFSQRTKELLVNLVICDSFVQVDQLEKVKARLVQTLSSALPELKGISILPYNGKADCIPFQEPQLIFGTSSYREVINSCEFKVSHSSFLQIHTPMAELLYDRILQCLGQEQVVLDLCSGIGTIGICLAKKSKSKKQFVGIQVVQAACHDAAQNSRINEVEYRIVQGKVQDHIKLIAQQYAGKRIAAVVDPPRAGLPKDAIKVLRTCRGLNTIVYVACNLSAVLDNIAQLCLEADKRRRGPRFRVQGVWGMDLFPGTQHFETILLLRRQQ